MCFSGDVRIVFCRDLFSVALTVLEIRSGGFDVFNFPSALFVEDDREGNTGEQGNDVDRDMNLSGEVKTIDISVDD